MTGGCAPGVLGSLSLYIGTHAMHAHTCCPKQQNMPKVGNSLSVVWGVCIFLMSRDLEREFHFQGNGTVTVVTLSLDTAGVYRTDLCPAPQQNSYTGRSAGWFPRIAGSVEQLNMSQRVWRYPAGGGRYVAQESREGGASLYASVTGNREVHRPRA